MNRRDLSPDRPYLVVRESEPDGQGNVVDVTTVFLTVSECPIGCTMCDLHQNTLLSATPAGAVPRQISMAGVDPTNGGWLKLYNSGNFFDPRSIPPADYGSIAERCRGFQRLVVENHPRFGSERLQWFRDLVDSQLEVAVGLETVQPRWLKRIGKQMTRDEFDRYARWLNKEGVDVRVFLIVGVPGIDTREAIRWSRLSVRHATQCGARHISLIPARPGHQWKSLAHQLPRLSIDQWISLQRKAIGDSRGDAAVTIDLWDVDRNTQGWDHLQRVNLTQRP